METVRGYTALPRRLRAPAVAIGNFDGVHRGHAHIFGETRRLAGTDEAVVLTFDPHPAKVLAPAYAPPLITPLGRKLELIAACGIDVTVVQPFDLAFAGLEPDRFVDEVLVGALGARVVVVGYDFTYGRRRSGTLDTLRAAGLRHGFQVHVVPAQTVDGLVCSSTKVREFVLEGRLDGARLLLGRDFEVQGEVVHGDARGRTIGVPTANLKSEQELLPRNGVYAGWAEVVGKPGRYGAAINVGTNPTFVRDMPVSVEVHLIDAELDLYGERLRVGFIERLRAEERFPSVDALVAQIRRDVDAARAIFAERSGS